MYVWGNSYTHTTHIHNVIINACIIIVHVHVSMTYNSDVWLTRLKRLYNIKSDFLSSWQNIININHVHVDRLATLFYKLLMCACPCHVMLVCIGNVVVHI